MCHGASEEIVAPKIHSEKSLEAERVKTTVSQIILTWKNEFLQNNICLKTAHYINN